MHTMPTPFGVAPLAAYAAPSPGEVRMNRQGPLLTRH